MLSAHRAGVLGSPVSHSLSPVLHRAAYDALGLVGWTYAAQEVTAEELGGYVERLDQEWCGLSLTMPLKESAFEVATEVSPLAREVGAINTLVRRQDGGWDGDNTDVHGLVRAILSGGVSGVERAVVLGSGATARSAVAALSRLGCARLTFVVRENARPQTVAQAALAGLAVDVVRCEQASVALRDADVVINTTPAGAIMVLDLADLPGGGRPLLVDVVYHPWPTPLASSFGAREARVVSGFEMLLHQAAEQVHLMTGLDAPVEAMRAAGLEAMAAR